MKKKKKSLFKIFGIVCIFLLVVLIVCIVGIKFFKEDLAFQNCGNGTVVYYDENYCWQKEVLDFSMEWDDAELYCKELALGGYDDWRLPTLEELEVIVDYDAVGDVRINAVAFSNTLKKHYWTSTEYRGKLNTHWYIHFELGHQGYARDYNLYEVRCVRELGYLDF